MSIFDLECLFEKPTYSQFAQPDFIDLMLTNFKKWTFQNL